MTYSEKLKDPRWQRKRLEVMQRDGFKCRDCGSSHETLHVHHCHYEKGEPWKTNLRFLLTLCNECHQTRQELENDAKMMLGEIMANTPLFGTSQKPHELSDFVRNLHLQLTNGGTA